MKQPQGCGTQRFSLANRDCAQPHSHDNVEMHVCGPYSARTRLSRPWPTTRRMASPCPSGTYRTPAGSGRQTTPRENSGRS
eukprot:4631331-Pyramimonas_sp.AAC.1